MIISRNTKLSQLYKALILYFGCEYDFIYEGNRIKANNDTIIFDGNSIICQQIKNCIGIGLKIFGKEITLKIKMENSSEENKYFYYNVGILNSIKDYLKMIEGLIDREIKGFYLDKKKIRIEEDRSFASLGIINDCEITLILEKKNKKIKKI